MGEWVGERAVVLGAGMAGLLTARVLSERYREVLLLDRDGLIGVTEPRRGVPQAHHAHALLAKGQEILERLFPGLQEELIADGALSGDLAGDHRWFFNGKQLAKAQSGLLTIAVTRSKLEAHVRARVAALPTVEVREHVIIQGLQATEDHSRITGVHVVAEADSAEPELITADLIVDATGRGSRTPNWLEELGYQRPDEEKIKIDLAYTSRFFKLNSDPFGTDLAINPVASPANPRGAFFGRYRDNVALLSLTGLLGDHPPKDDAGFLEFARTLSTPEIYEAVRDAEPIGEITSFRVPATVRRRYDKLQRFPQGYLVIGDGICAFNPVYGQGMTVSAMEAAALGEHLRHGEVRALDFFRETAPIVDVPWEISVGGDLAFPGVEGPRPLMMKIGNAYMAKLHTAAQLDGKFTGAFFRVASLLDPPQSLMKPRMIFDVLRTARRVKTSARRRPAERVAAEHAAAG